MLSLFEYILYEKIQNFAKGKDVDFQAMNNRSESTIILDEKDIDTYKLTSENLHGGLSHAVKHYNEFDPDEYKKIAYEVKEALKSEYEKSEFPIFLVSNHSIKVEGKNVFKRASITDYMNLLDVLNDKKIQRKSFNQIENKIFKIGDKLTKKYMDELNKRIDASKFISENASTEEIEKIISTSNYISFSGWGKNNMFQNIVLGLKDNTIVIYNDKSLRTGWKYDGDAIKSWLHNQGNKFQPENKNLKQVFRRL